MIRKGDKIKVKHNTLTGTVTKTFTKGDRKYVTFVRDDRGTKSTYELFTVEKIEPDTDLQVAMGILNNLDSLINYR